MSAKDEIDRTINLHPLVLINLADHQTRSKCCTDAEPTKTVGAIYGFQDGLNVHIYDSCELVIDPSTARIDMEFLAVKTDQVQQCFPSYELLGWYSVGASASEKDIALHKQITEVNDNPLFLLLNPEHPQAERKAAAAAEGAEAEGAKVIAKTKKIPVTMYESVVHMLNDSPTAVFVPVEYKIETSEVERITAEVATSFTVGENGGDSLKKLHAKLRNSLHMLSSRVEVIEQFLTKTHSGEIKKNHLLLRSIGSICKQLPVVDDSSGLQQEFDKEYQDALLVAYLANLTKGVNVLSQCFTKVTLASPRNRPIM